MQNNRPAGSCYGSGAFSFADLLELLLLVTGSGLCINYLLSEPLLLDLAHREAVADGLERGLTAEQARSSKA